MSAKTNAVQTYTAKQQKIVEEVIRLLRGKKVSITTSTADCLYDIGNIMVSIPDKDPSKNYPYPPYKKIGNDKVWSSTIVWVDENISILLPIEGVYIDHSKKYINIVVADIVVSIYIHENTYAEFLAQISPYLETDSVASRNCVYAYDWGQLTPENIRDLTRKVCNCKYGYILIDRVLNLDKCPLRFEDFAFLSDDWTNPDYRLTERCMNRAEKIGQAEKKSVKEIGRIIRNFRTKGSPSWEAIRFENSD
jgi:hypothetical protein